MDNLGFGSAPNGLHGVNHGVNHGVAPVEGRISDLMPNGSDNCYKPENLRRRCLIFSGKWSVCVPLHLSSMSRSIGIL